MNVGVTDGSAWSTDVKHELEAWDILNSSIEQGDEQDESMIRMAYV